MADSYCVAFDRPDNADELIANGGAKFDNEKPRIDLIPP